MWYCYGGGVQSGGTRSTGLKPSPPLAAREMSSSPVPQLKKQGEHWTGSPESEPGV